MNAVRYAESVIFGSNLSRADAVSNLKDVFADKTEALVAFVFDTIAPNFKTDGGALADFDDGGDELPEEAAPKKKQISSVATKVIIPPK